MLRFIHFAGDQNVNIAGINFQEQVGIRSKLLLQLLAIFVASVL
jgi:hypothetical protein